MSEEPWGWRRVSGPESGWFRMGSRPTDVKSSGSCGCVAQVWPCGFGWALHFGMSLESLGVILGCLVICVGWSVGLMTDGMDREMSTWVL